MFKKYSLLTLLAMLLPIFGGCTDDIMEFESEFQEKEAPGLRINVPHVDVTRAGASISNPDTPDDKELVISDLWLVAYPTNGGTPEIRSLNEQTKSAVKGSYDEHTLKTFPNGTYKFYIVGNIFGDDAPDATTYNTPEKLKAKIVSYANAMMAYPQTANYLGMPLTGDHRDMYTKSGSDEIALPDAGYKYEGGATIYSDLIYCLAKVTVKVEDTNGEYISNSLTSAQLKGFATGFPLFTSVASVSGVSTSESVIAPDPLKPTDTDNVTYTFYVPENTYAGNPVLNLAVKNGATTYNKALTLGEVNKSTGAYSLKRGHHYAYTLSKKGDITLDVYAWQIDKFSVTINAPFELVLYNGEDFKNGEVTKKISSTEKARFKYYTDAETISIVSPEFSWVDDAGKTQTVDFYKWDIDGDEISVWVNNAVPLAKYNSSTEQEKYKYFHVKANNLMKRVEVKEIGTDPMFIVDPVQNIVDLREILGLGYETVSYNVDYAANFGNVNVEIGKWKDSKGDPILDSWAQQACSMIATSAASGSYCWTFGGFDKGLDFYKDRRYLTVKFSVVARSGNTEDEGFLSQMIADGDPTEYEVTFTVIPYSSNYVIHFKPNTTWGAPHIYAYQCLELPADLTGTNASNKGRTVGASKDQAALQYCFSSGFAFLGWTGYGGDINPNAAGSYNTDATKNNGFFIFSDTSHNGFFPYSGTFGESGLNTYKYVWYDFNAAHYERLKNAGQSKCPYDQCAWATWPTETNRICKLWPGIIMEEEENGWWRYELSGVAEPGKTLIMFGDGHSDCSLRFPFNNEVGIPLFDFESKEGWFKYTGDGGQEKNYFRSYNPEEKFDDPYTIYWPKYKDGNDYKTLYDCTYANHVTNPSSVTIGGVEYYYATVEGNSLKIILKATDVSSWDDAKCTKDLVLTPTSFKDKCATITLTTRSGDPYRYNANIVPGKPSGSETPDPPTPSGSQYKLYWPATLGLDGTEYQVSKLYQHSGKKWIDGISTKHYNQPFYYCELGETLPTSGFNITTGSDWKVQSKDFTLSAGNFSNEKIGYVVFTYDNNEKNKYSIEIKPGLPLEPALAANHQRLMYKNDKSWSDVYVYLFDGSANAEHKKATKCEWVYGWWYIDVNKGDYKKAIWESYNNFSNQQPSNSSDEWDFSNDGDHVYIGSDGKRYSGSDKPTGGPAAARRKTMKVMPKVIKRR